MINQIESIIERLVRDLNRNEDVSGNTMEVRKTKIINIIEELTEIQKQLEGERK